MARVVRWLLVGSFLFSCGAPPGATQAPPDAATPDASVDASDAGPEDAGLADAGVGVEDAGSPRRPAAFDAVFNRGDGKLFFFKGGEYLRYDVATDMADTSPAYPRPIAGLWPGLWDAGLTAASETGDGKVLFFRGGEFAQYDLARDAVDPGFPKPLSARWALPGDVEAAGKVAGELQLFGDGEVARFALDGGAPLGLAPANSVWPGVGDEPIDAVLELGTNVYVFQGDTYRRFDASTRAPAAGYPRETKWWWPGMWDPQDGTGHPGERLPAVLAQQLFEQPDATELAARRQRVAASATADWVDRSADYPLFLASIERRLGAWGCGLFSSVATPTEWRFRCATHTRGPQRLDVERLTVPFIDWARGAYHVDQVSQGDFLADVGTPLSIFASDDGVFFIDSVTANAATGSINAGLNIRVRFRAGGADHFIGFSHLNTRVPGYVLDALRDGTPLPNGTVFGFIGYTGNLWIGAPPATDAAYQGTGAGLPAAHSHLWFKDEADDHRALSVRSRRAIDFTRAYPYGGG